MPPCHCGAATLERMIKMKPQGMATKAEKIRVGHLVYWRLETLMDDVLTIGDATLDDDDKAHLRNLGRELRFLEELVETANK